MGKHLNKRGWKEINKVDMIRQLAIDKKNPKLKYRDKLNLIIF